MQTAVRDQEGNPLDAHFEVEEGAIIFHSRGGTKNTPKARNTQYGEGLRLILDRLVAAALPIRGIWVDSSRVQHLPMSDRLIASAEEATLDVGSLFSLASRRMQSVGKPTGDSAGGNNNKRLRIGLEGNLSDTEILRIISGPDSVSPSATTEPFPSSEADGAATIAGTGGRRVWATSFWGFNPEGDGYFGFTRKGDREWFLSQLKLDDLVMVYATSNPSAEEALRGRVLGFLEVEHRRIRDTDRMSPEGIAWKVGAGVEDRWTFAVPVRRAWRAVDTPYAREIAPVTLGPTANHQLIASRGILLTEEEAGRALELPVRPVDVYGEAALDDEEKAKVYAPSRGFPVSFGKRSFETADGAHFLYALQLVGSASAFLADPPHVLRGKVIVKVGLAKDPSDRCDQHNSALPPAGLLRWKLILKSPALENGQAALNAETALKQCFSQTYRSLGGEFFLCDERTLAVEFAKCARE